jgi:hypothetical protein
MTKLCADVKEEDKRMASSQVEIRNFDKVLCICEKTRTSTHIHAWRTSGSMSKSNKLLLDILEETRRREYKRYFGAVCRINSNQEVHYVCSIPELVDRHCASSSSNDMRTAAVEALTNSFDRDFPDVSDHFQQTWPEWLRREVILQRITYCPRSQKFVCVSANPHAFTLTNILDTGMIHTFCAAIDGGEECFHHSNCWLDVGSRARSCRRAHNSLRHPSKKRARTEDKEESEVVVQKLAAHVNELTCQLLQSQETIAKHELDLHVLRRRMQTQEMRSLGMKDNPWYQCSLRSL